MAATGEALIPQFYADKTILITGATGFMGKVLVERLLSSCPRVRRLLLLLRGKRDAPPEKRLLQLKQAQVFDVVRARDPAQLDKLVALPGDTAAERLGLDQLGLQMLHEVSVVFHCAATVRFDEPLRAAVDQNVRSATRLLALCDQLPNVQAFVHVSTAYCNAELDVVEEKVYPSPVALDELFTLVDSLPKKILDEITPSYIHPKPNTYTFTKSMAEVAVRDHGCKNYPIAIFRPSIVVSTLRHPFPGWVENLNGPAGVVLASGKGLLHAFSCRGAARADLMPADMAIDTLLAAAWETALDRAPEVRVYNCSSCAHPTTWRVFKDGLRRRARDIPFDNALWYPAGVLVSNKFSRMFFFALLNTMPLYFAEYITKLLGIKMKFSLIAASHKLRAMDEALQFFSMRQWHFATDNVRRLHERLSAQDRAIYNLDVHTIDWQELIKNFVLGTRRYLLKEKDENIPEARRHMRRLAVLHYVTMSALAIVFIRLLLCNNFILGTVSGTFRTLSLILNKAIGF